MIVITYVITYAKDDDSTTVIYKEGSLATSKMEQCKGLFAEHTLDALTICKVTVHLKTGFSYIETVYSIYRETKKARELNPKKVIV